MSTSVSTRPDEDLSLVPAKPRIGDKVFSGLSTGAGILIFVILAAVALFLIVAGATGAEPQPSTRA